MALDFLKQNGFDLEAELSKVQFGGQDEPAEDKLKFDASGDSNTIKVITGVKLPRRPLLWDIHLEHGKIASIEPHYFNGPNRSNEAGVLEGKGRLITPSLCHAHIHLDKCFLLQDSKFSDLQITKGDFAEAMELTNKAKARFSKSDLLRRGRQLITESIHAGVTTMRAFVEVDGDVMFKCLDAGLTLKKEFAKRCDIQICAFAQLPLFSGKDNGEVVRKLMSEAAERDGVEVVGSTPYVEDDATKEKKNIDWITNLAMRVGMHLDLHLDYHLDPSKDASVWSVLETIKAERWIDRKGKNITMGHCTRLTYFKSEEWNQLKELIGQLPVSFVGLPTSDLVSGILTQLFSVGSCVASTEQGMRISSPEPPSRRLTDLFIRLENPVLLFVWVCNTFLLHLSFHSFHFSIALI
jgi:cytosine/adenosine deaminase-related metal-dependent hydrolase